MNRTCRLHTVFPHSRQGFSLLELLIAMSLTLTLMGMLYTAMDLHYRFSTVGQIEVERSQIARALLSQMTADIRSTVYVPEKVVEEEEEDDSSDATADEEIAVDPMAEFLPPDLAFAGASLGLFGDSESLVIHARRPRRTAASADMESVEIADGDLRTVGYFLAGGESSMSITYGDMVTTRRPVRSNPEQDVTGVSRMVGNPMTLSLLEDPADAGLMTSEAVILAEEIEALQFEYHDGYEWVSEWDSQALEKLPGAVRITITFRDEEFDELSMTRQTASDITREFSIVVPLPAANPFETLTF